MPGLVNDTYYAANFDFSGNTTPAKANGLITDGEFWIGTTVPNLGGTTISVGKITSPSGTVGVGYSFPNITLDVLSEGITWSVISANQTLVVNHGYICVSPGGALSLALPAVSSIGNIIEITLDGATSFTITQGAGQQIRVGNVSTTSGVGGTLGSTQQGDSIRMVCQTANLKWNVLSTMGNPTIV